MNNHFKYLKEGKAQDTSITQPAHYVEGRTIEPINVIDSWGLCPSLSNVVKYISRAGRKEDALKDLGKAEWYLMRKIRSFESLHQSSHLSQKTSDCLEDVAQDWNLSSHLKSALGLTRILESQQRSYKAHAVHDLLKCLVHLRAEIKRLREKGDLSHA